MMTDDKVKKLRENAVRIIIGDRGRLAELGLYRGEVAPHDFEESALDKFLSTLGQDDDEAVEAAISLVYALSNASRGTVPAYLMMWAGMKPRPRSAMLKEAWISGKSGSVLGINTGKPLLFELFRQAVPEALMDAEEMATLASLPKKAVTVYRGTRSNRAVRGLSWTRDQETARWFATHGHGRDTGRVYAAEIPRGGIYALWESSGREPEVIVNPRRLRDIRIVEDDVPCTVYS